MFCISGVQAQSWPNKPIRLVVPYPPGGGTDVVARLVAEPLSQELGQTVFIDNKGGANGIIGCNFVANAAPDGYTFLVAAGNTHVFATLLNDKISYDPVKDFQPITQFDTTPNILVSHPGFPPK